MFYLIAEAFDFAGIWNLFRYLSFRTGGAMFTAGLFVFWFGPWIISLLRLREGKGQPIREDGPQTHLLTKRGTPTMGGLMILAGCVVAILLWASLREMAGQLRQLPGRAVSPVRGRHPPPTRPRDRVAHDRGARTTVPLVPERQLRRSPRRRRRA